MRELAIWARYAPGFQGALAQQVGGPWNYFFDDSASVACLAPSSGQTQAT